MKQVSHAHAREKLLSSAARFPRTSGGRALMREAYELSFMRSPHETTEISGINWDDLAGKLSFALARPR